MATHFDGHMPPLRVPDMKGIMIHVGPRIFAYQLAEFTGAGRLGLPNQRRCLGDEDQKQPTLPVVRGKVLLRHLMLVLPRGAVDDRDAMGFGPGTKTTAESAGHAHQMVVVQIFIGTVQLPPPHAKASRRLPHSEICIQYYTIDTIVMALQKIGVKIAQLVSHVLRA